MIRWEMHLHTSPASECASDSWQEMVKKSHSAGYAGAFITDHHTDMGYMSYMLSSVRYNPLEVWPGIEVTLMDFDSGFGGDVLVLSDRAEDLEAGMTPGSPSGSFDLLRKFPDRCIKIWAHPTCAGFLVKRYVPQMNQLLDLVDGIEMRNGKRGWVSEYNPEILPLLEARTDRFHSSGSDAHAVNEIGSGGLLLPHHPENLADFKKMLVNGEHELI